MSDKSYEAVKTQIEVLERFMEAESYKPLRMYLGDDNKVKVCVSVAHTANKPIGYVYVTGDGPRLHPKSKT
jgi:GTP cyclohydrolase III